MAALNFLKQVLERVSVQRGLVHLYSLSQSECTRNKCGMEIGMSREKDQVAVLKYALGDRINLDIDNTLPEDFIFNAEKFSVKHSGSKIGTPVKAKWTSADKSVQDTIEAMITAAESYYPHLLITYIDARAKKITIIGISSETNRSTIKEMKHGAFKIPAGNSRGIEYSTTAMKRLLEKKSFVVEINDADLTGGVDPIQRRIQLLTAAEFNP